MKLENVQGHISFVYKTLTEFQKCGKLCTVEVVSTEALEPEFYF